MDIALLVLASVLMVLGLIGCFAPVLPGPPLCYLALLCVHFTHKYQFTPGFLITWAVLVVLVIILEYVIPLKATKKFGGSRAGEWGALIGLLVGIVIIPPIGAIGGTVVGALLGELLVNNAEMEKAAKAALGALVGFIFSTALKLAISIAMLIFLIAEVIKQGNMS
ncbi:MAG: DUF456 domain-containing protein [Chitinophagales bacterium]